MKNSNSETEQSASLTAPEVPNYILRLRQERDQPDQGRGKGQRGRGSCEAGERAGYKWATEASFTELSGWVGRARSPKVHSFDENTLLPRRETIDLDRFCYQTYFAGFLNAAGAVYDEVEAQDSDRLKDDGREAAGESARADADTPDTTQAPEKQFDRSRLLVAGLGVLDRQGRDTDSPLHLVASSAVKPLAMLVAAVAGVEVGGADATKVAWDEYRRLLDGWRDKALPAHKRDIKTLMDLLREAANSDQEPEATPST